MKYAVLLLTFCMILFAGVFSKAVPSQQAASDYEVAYERWRRAIESNPMLGDPFWVSTEGGPPEFRNAVANILSFGPNLTPFLTEKLRTETDNVRIYQLMLLLNKVSGINLYYGRGEQIDYTAAFPRFRDSFIEDWDSGKYQNATALLRATWTDNETSMEKEIDPNSLIPVRRYGVFAFPFMFTSLEENNSAKLFAAFLIITGEQDLYSSYLKDPSSFLPERDQKVVYMTAWAQKNEKKIDKLVGLHQQIKALTNR